MTLVAIRVTDFPLMPQCPSSKIRSKIKARKFSTEVALIPFLMYGVRTLNNFKSIRITSA